MDKKNLLKAEKATPSPFHSDRTPTLCFTQHLPVKRQHFYSIDLVLGRADIL